MGAQAWAYGPARPRRRRSRVLGAVVGFVLAASVVAVAAWIVTQPAGKGFSKAGSLVAPTTVDIATAELTGDLTPGGVGDVSIKVTNGNAIPVRLVGTGTFAFATSDKANCVSSNVLSQNGDIQAAIDATPPIPAGQTVTLVLSDAVAMSSTAPTDCQNARFPINLSLTFATV